MLRSSPSSSTTATVARGLLRLPTQTATPPVQLAWLTTTTSTRCLHSSSAARTANHEALHHNHNHNHNNHHEALHTHPHGHHDHSFVLLYEYPKDMAVRRDPYRAAHLALAQKLKEDGKLLSAGPFSDATGAAFVFKAKKRQEVEEFVRADPYYKHGLVTHYSIKEWHPLF